MLFYRDSFPFDKDGKAHLCLIHHTSFTLYYLILQPSVRTRRTNGSADDTTFGGALKFFSNITIARSTTKKIGSEEIQLLLVHGFQVIDIACIGLHV